MIAPFADAGAATGRRRSASRSLAPRAARRRAANRLRAASLRKLEEIAQSDRPIVAGPWTGGTGMELLYWIPLLTWLTTKGGVSPERIVAISRGGADSWYGNVAEHYVDLLDHFSLSQVQAREGRPAQRRAPRPTGRDWLERSAFRLACDVAGTSRAEWLQPSLMSRLFAPRWDWGAPASTVLGHTMHRPLPVEPGELPELPESFVALRASFNPNFPDTPENRLILDRLVSAVSRRVPVVLLRSPEGIDSHEPFVPSARESVHDLSELMTLRSGLAVQTMIVRQARVFVTTYGGFACLGSYVGTPTVALYTKAGFDLIHFDAIDRVGQRLAAGATRLFRARHIGAIPVAREEVTPAPDDYSVRNG